MLLTGEKGNITYMDDAEVKASVPGQNYNRAWPVWREKALARAKAERG